MFGLRAFGRGGKAPRPPEKQGAGRSSSLLGLRGFSESARSGPTALPCCHPVCRPCPAMLALCRAHPGSVGLDSDEELLGRLGKDQNPRAHSTRKGKAKQNPRQELRPRSPPNAGCWPGSGAGSRDPDLADRLSLESPPRSGDRESTRLPSSAADGCECTGGSLRRRRRGGGGWRGNCCQSRRTAERAARQGARQGGRSRRASNLGRRASGAAGKVAGDRRCQAAAACAPSSSREEMTARRPGSPKVVTREIGAGAGSLRRVAGRAEDAAQLPSRTTNACSDTSRSTRHPGRARDV